MDCFIAVQRSCLTYCRRERPQPWGSSGSFGAGAGVCREEGGMGLTKVVLDVHG